VFYLTVPLTLIAFVALVAGNCVVPEQFKLTQLSFSELLFSELLDPGQLRT